MTELWAVAVLGTGALHAMPNAADAAAAAQDINAGMEHPVVVAGLWPGDGASHARSLAQLAREGVGRIKISAQATNFMHGLSTKRRVKAVEKLVAMKALWTSAGWVLPDPADIEPYREAVSFYATYANRAAQTCMEERDFELMKRWDEIAVRQEALLKTIDSRRKPAAADQPRVSAAA